MMEHYCKAMTLGDHSIEKCTICGADLSKATYKELLESLEQAKSNERERILKILQDRHEDLLSCTKDDNCQDLAEIVAVCIDDIKYEDTENLFTELL
jgi:hypothetical protein